MNVFFLVYVVSCLFKIQHVWGSTFPCVYDGNTFQAAVDAAPNQTVTIEFCNTTIDLLTYNKYVTAVNTLVEIRCNPLRPCTIQNGFLGIVEGRMYIDNVYFWNTSLRSESFSTVEIKSSTFRWNKHEHVMATYDSNVIIHNVTFDNNLFRESVRIPSFLNHVVMHECS
jgi:hypothetical protein